MPKTVDCPIKGFSGSVVFHDPLTWPMLIQFEEARTNALQFRDSEDVLKMFHAYLPGIIACVEEWKLDSGKHYTAEDFPSTPTRRAVLMLDWLVMQILAIIAGEETDPNE